MNQAGPELRDTAWRLDGLLSASQDHAWYHCSPRTSPSRFTHVGKFLLTSPRSRATSRLIAGDQPADYLSRQAFLTSVLGQPSIIMAIDYRLSGPHKYVVYPRLALRTVRPMERAKQRNHSRQPWSLLVELLQALQSIHELGFVHRQVNPRHILVDSDGRLVLTGFGRCQPVGHAQAPPLCSATQRSRQVTAAHPANDIRSAGEWLVHWLGNSARTSPLVQAMLAPAGDDRPSANELLGLLQRSQAA